MSNSWPLKTGEFNRYNDEWLKAKSPVPIQGFHCKGTVNTYMNLQTIVGRMLYGESEGVLYLEVALICSMWWSHKEQEVRTGNEKVLTSLVMVAK